MGKIDARPLKAFVRFDGSGRIVAGSLILRRKKPKVGKWVEIPAYECCNPTTTTTTTGVPVTTTTTTAAPTTTTTTTEAPVCIEYTIVVPDGGSASISGVDCEGNNFSGLPLTGPINAPYCFRSVTGIGDINISITGPCNP
jgi:hypothetical protein